VASLIFDTVKKQPFTQIADVVAFDENQGNCEELLGQFSRFSGLFVKGNPLAFKI
jgi:hypothetical protein